MHYPFLRLEHIEAQAEALLQRGLGADARREPRVDLERLLYDYLCEREALSFTDELELGFEGEEQVLGRTWPIAGKIEISLSLTAPEEVGRYRFTVAHELGHWVLHRPLFQAAMANLDLFGDSQRSEILTSLNHGVFPDGARGPVPTEEWQANRFAVALLFSAELLRDAWERRFGVGPIAWRSPRLRLSGDVGSKRACSRLLAKARVGGEDPLHAMFGVSVEAMAIALESRGYLIEHPTLL